MARILTRALSVLAAFSFLSALSINQVSAQSALSVARDDYTWSVSASQTLRICMIFVAIPGIKDNSAASSDKRKHSLYFPETMNQSGEVLLQAELSVPAGEFRCIDIPYDELLRAGFEPDPTTGALTFRVRIPASSQGGGNTASVGTLMNIDSLTGKVELYQNTERELVDILQTIKRDLDAGTSNFEN